MSSSGRMTVVGLAGRFEVSTETGIVLDRENIPEAYRRYRQVDLPRLRRENPGFVLEGAEVAIGRLGFYYMDPGEIGLKYRPPLSPGSG